MNLRSQLISAFRGSFLIRISSLALSMLGSVVLARALGVSQFGVYSWVLSIVTLLALPTQVGLPTLLVRETAKYHAAKEWAALKGVWAWSARLIVRSSLLIGLLAAIVLWLLSDWVDANLRMTLAAGLLLLPLMVLGDARGAVLRGLRRIVYGQLPDGVIRPAVLVIAVAIAWGCTDSVSAPLAMVFHAVAAAVAFMIGAWWLWQMRPVEVIRAKADFSDISVWRKAVLPLAMISGLQVISNQIAIVQLGIFRTATDVALYKVAASGAGLTLIVVQVVSMVSAPHIARLHAQNDHMRLQKLASIGVLVNVAMTIPFLLLFGGFGDRVLHFLYGVEFVPAYGVLVWLTLAKLMSAAFGAVGLLLNMTGYERDSLRGLIISTLVNLILSALLIPDFGAMGAAWAMLVTTIIWNLVLWRAVKNRLGIDSGLLAAMKMLWRADWRNP